MFGGMAPMAGCRLPGILDVYFHPLGSDTAWNISVEPAKLCNANSALDMCETFLLVV